MLAVTAREMLVSTFYIFIFLAIFYLIGKLIYRISFKEFNKYEKGLKWLREKCNKTNSHIEELRVGPNQLRVATNQEWYLFEVKNNKAIATKDKTTLSLINEGLLKRKIRIPYLYNQKR